MPIMDQGIGILKDGLIGQWLWQPESRAQTKAITKPVMRGLLARQIKRQLMMATLLSTIGGFSYWYFVAQPRKKAYAEYYRTLDADKMCEEMASKGLFQSCPRPVKKVKKAIEAATAGGTAANAA